MSAAAVRAVMADAPGGFNGEILKVERTLEALQRRFDRGFPAGADTPALKLATDSAGAALGALRTLRWALASAPARKLVDRLHAEAAP